MINNPFSMAASHLVQAAYYVLLADRQMTRQEELNEIPTSYRTELSDMLYDISRLIREASKRSVHAYREPLELQRITEADLADPPPDASFPPDSVIEIVHTLAGIFHDSL